MVLRNEEMKAVGLVPEAAYGTALTGSTLAEDLVGGESDFDLAVGLNAILASQSLIKLKIGTTSQLYTIGAIAGVNVAVTPVIVGAHSTDDPVYLVPYNVLHRINEFPVAEERGQVAERVQGSPTGGDYKFAVTDLGPEIASAVKGEIGPDATDIIESMVDSLVTDPFGRDADHRSYTAYIVDGADTFAITGFKAMSHKIILGDDRRENFKFELPMETGKAPIDIPTYVTTGHLHPYVGAGKNRGNTTVALDVLYPLASDAASGQKDIILKSVWGLQVDDEMQDVAGDITADDIGSINTATKTITMDTNLDASLIAFDQNDGQGDMMHLSSGVFIRIIVNSHEADCNENVEHYGNLMAASPTDETTGYSHGNFDGEGSISMKRPGSLDSFPDPMDIAKDSLGGVIFRITVLGYQNDWYPVAKKTEAGTSEAEDTEYEMDLILIDHVWS